MFLFRVPVPSFNFRDRVFVMYACHARSYLYIYIILVYTLRLSLSLSLFLSFQILTTRSILYFFLLSINDTSFDLCSFLTHSNIKESK